MAKKKHSEKKESSVKNKTHKKQNNVWKTSFIFSAIVIIVLLGVILTDIGIGSSKITADAAGQRALNLINGGLVPPGTEISVDAITNEGGVYQLNISLTYNNQTQSVTSYMSKDGKYFFPQGMDINEILTKEVNKEVQNQQQTPQTPKTDTPKAEAFVMSHCPYGLQFMKAFVPVMDLLKDKADLKIGFVDYIMHGVDEFNDNNRIYCIQKDAPTKLTEYLRCFV
ncbi:MAG: hypothetical protein J7L08_00025, partial [Candidatus Aenigmarchaeota archaeon]|nr:hypothetical protein [Candidatus Aenigmarchaeota archaeon]